MRTLSTSELDRVHGGLRRTAHMSPESAIPPGQYPGVPPPPPNWVEFGDSGTGGDNGTFHVPLGGTGPLECSFLPGLPNSNGQCYGVAYTADGGLGLYLQNTTGNGTFLGEFTHDLDDSGWNIGLEDTINNVHLSGTVSGDGSIPDSVTFNMKITW